ncbi:MAG: hypothetical protein JSR93_04175 [Verrucomicrobia bacterium]|nr:hypothetical protein [Verrucomicrobiota bacterium]
MHDVSLQKKNKITLEDYDFRQDIENRLLMGQFTSVDLEVLEEILYSSITIPIRKLAKNLSLEEEELLPILQKLSKSGLFAYDDETITVDKELRKYFETQIMKFDPDFKPGMEYLQSLLRKVPIHVLPIWYSIPRTSNNIFESLVEKYLLTPQIFQRYLLDLNFPNPTLNAIIKDVYSAPDFSVFAKDLVDKYSLSKEQFEEYLLYLEFNFVCCLGYRKVDDDWKEIVTPFHEWHEYLMFLRTTEAPSITTPEKIQRARPQDFSFIQDISAVLKMAKKQPIPLAPGKNGLIALQPAQFSTLASKLEGFKENDPDLPSYIDRLISKLRILKLADIVDDRLYALEAANDWLDMRPENRAIFLYRHPLNRLDNPKISSQLCTDRNIKEAEKSIQRVLNSGWVYLDDFIRGTIVPLGEDSLVMLKRQGKTWKYCLPSYSEEEASLIRSVIYDWLFEIGVTAIGLYEGKECFMVTPFGQSLFGR